MSKIPKNFRKLDTEFRAADRAQIQRTRNIQRIPDFENRKGGKVSYAEWAHVIGIFQTLFYQHLKTKTSNQILDIGCGSGLLAMAAEPFLSENGKYTGIDVMQKSIGFCKKNYPKDSFEFIHLDAKNPAYSDGKSQPKWPLENDSFDLVSALSVWTHFGENDAVFYIKECARVLKKKGRAILTFFLLDEDYKTSLNLRQDAPGRFHATNQNLWIFDSKSYESNHWLSPKWADPPEDAVGITKKGLEILLKESGLKLIKKYPGNWKEKPGVYFQDVLVFEKE